MKTKKAYTKPELKVYGDVAELTLGNTGGKNLDGGYPVGTDDNTGYNNGNPS